MTYNERFKDRAPEETIKIISSFFENRGFRLDIIPIGSDIGTWSCLVKLYYNNIFIKSTNGKGTTYEYALASGLGEMYERFCNIGHHIDSRLTSLALNKIRKENFGYYKDKEEILLTHDEIWKHNNIKEVAYSIGANSDKDKDTYAACATDNLLIGEPYYNILTNQVEYFNSNLDFTMGGTNGMAGGNTFEEAFNQGMSEIAERYVMTQFFNDTNIKYHVINSDRITNPVIKKLIHNLQLHNIKLTILDCSYDSELPVVCVLLWDLKMKRTHICFGSFPVFDIALERCITEIYQCVTSLNTLFTPDLQMPARYEDPDAYAKKEFYNDMAHFHYIPEYILNNLIYDDIINTNVFLVEDNFTNKELLEYWKKIITNKEWDIYVKENGLIPQMNAIKIIMTNKLCFHRNLIKSDNHLVNWNIVGEIYNLLHKYIDSFLNEYDFELYYNTYLQTKRYAKLYPDEYNFTFNFFFIEGPDNLFVHSELNRVDNMLKDIRSSSLFMGYNSEQISHPQIRKYATIFKYLLKRKYKLEELKEILTHLGIMITENDMKNLNNDKYLIEQILYKPVYEMFHSNEFSKILLGYLKEDEYNAICHKI